MVILAAMWILGAFALSAVFVLEHREHNRVRAQLVLADLRNTVTNLPNVAFSADQGLSRAQVQAGLAQAQRNIRTSATLLTRLGGDEQDQSRIMAPTRELFGVLERASLLAITGEPAKANVVIGEASLPGAPNYRLNNVITNLGVRFNRDAAQARSLVEIGAFSALVVVLLAFSLAFYRVSSLVREKHHLLLQSQEEALTDPLTGLANRRQLFADMGEMLGRQSGEDRVALGMFDLDGFKIYNDTFGHPAGDALLARLAHRLDAAVEGQATAYRMGGDEFCVIAHGADAEAVLATAQIALSEENDDFTVRCSAGIIEVVSSDTTLEQALRVADQRLYNSKRSARTREGGEVHDVLLRVLAEHSHSLASHVSTVGRLAEAVARKLALSDDDIMLTKLTAELHDIGKTAVPNDVLEKPGPLDEDEWDFMRQHTIIGERILAAAPTLGRVASLVRSTHERADGAGYPDGLRADEIPLSSRIVAVVDAYDAMTSNRPYSMSLSAVDAIAELRRCTGTQFDRAVVQAFAAVWAESEKPADAELKPAA